MKFNLKNRVDQLPLGKDQALRPVYEAVANAFDAIHDSRDDLPHKVVVRITRGLPPDQRTIDGSKPTGPITGFEIEDDGVGFTDTNFDSFSEAYSEQKKKSGGLGSGRMLWLKAFESAAIESTYKERGGRMKFRLFHFNLTDSVKPVDSDHPPGQRTGSLVRLLRPGRETLPIMRRVIHPGASSDG